jgi:ribosomal protein L34E
MVEPKKKTRSVKKVSRRTPKGLAVKHFKKEKTSPPRCGRCGRVVPPKPNKVYGRALCADCTTDILRYVVEWKVKFLSPEMKDLDLSRDLTLERFLPKGWYANLSQGVFGKRKTPRAFKREKPKEEAKAPEAAEKPKPAKKTKAAKKPSGKKKKE